MIFRKGDLVRFKKTDNQTFKGVYKVTDILIDEAELDISGAGDCFYFSNHRLELETRGLESLVTPEELKILIELNGPEVENKPKP